MSYQDVQHFYQEYDPCEHGGDSSCLECEVASLRKQLTAETAEADALAAALMGMVWTFAFTGWTKEQTRLLHTGGLPVLRAAFAAINWSDPITCDDARLFMGEEVRP